MFKMTTKRRELLANFSLNIVVISFGVAAFEHNWLGILAAFAGWWAFLMLTKEV